VAINVALRSRLRFAQLLEIDGFTFWDTLEPPDIPEQSDDISYDVKSHDRIDLLANRFYGDPVLWWVIAVANDMEIIPTDFNVGDILRIPSPRFVLQELFTDTTPKITT